MHQAVTVPQRAISTTTKTKDDTDGLYKRSPAPVTMDARVATAGTASIRRCDGWQRSQPAASTIAIAHPYIPHSQTLDTSNHTLRLRLLLLPATMMPSNRARTMVAGK